LEGFQGYLNETPLRYEEAIRKYCLAIQENVQKHISSTDPEKIKIKRIIQLLEKSWGIVDPLPFFYKSTKKILRTGG
jgi:hypothetical protein